MRQPQRHARQGGCTHVPETAGGGIDVRELTDADTDRIGDLLPLHRLPARQTYLIAWEHEEPVGQAHIAWARTKLGVPEIQDVFVPEPFRRRGIATALALAAERLAAQQGHKRVSLGCEIANEGARRLYEGLGYRNAGLEPEHVRGVIRVRSGFIEVDDTLIYLVKELPPA